MWFADGTYLELFNWYDTPPKGDNWSDKDPGLVDWAISATDASQWEPHFDGIMTRLNANNSTGDGALGVRYPPLVSGGRDGNPNMWRTSDREFYPDKRTPPAKYFPTGRLEAPFVIYYSGDRNPSHPNKTEHPSGAVGLDSIEVLVPPQWADEYRILFTSIIGNEPELLAADQGFVFELGIPHSTRTSRLWVRKAESKEDLEYILTRGIGISRVNFLVEGREGFGREPLGTSGTSSRVSLVW